MTDLNHCSVNDSDKELSILEVHEVRTNWRQKAEWRRANKQWLDYSRRIAVMVLNRLDELNMSQKQLASSMGCSPQYVSKILKGSENLTLQTISTLEKVLEFNILSRL